MEISKGVMTLGKGLGLAFLMQINGASAGLLSNVADTLSDGLLNGGSVERSVTVEKCVELPASDSYFAGVATPLTGALGVAIPSLGTVTVCAVATCDVTGGVEITPEAPSFSECDLGYSLDGSGTGSCVTTISVSTILGDRVIYADRQASVDGYPLFPLEVCLAKTSD